MQGHCANAGGGTRASETGRGVEAAEVGLTADPPETCCCDQDSRGSDLWGKRRGNESTLVALSPGCGTRRRTGLTDTGELLLT